MNSLLAYIGQFVPIIVGIFIMYVARSIHLSKYRIRIKTDSKPACDRRKIDTSHRRIALPVHFDELPSNKIKRHYSENYRRMALNLLGAWEGLILWKGFVYDHGNVRNMVFRKYVYDALILNGRLNRIKISDYGMTAFSEFGLIEIEKVNRLLVYLRRFKKDKINLFAKEKTCFLPAIMTFGKTSGILLGYMLEYRLEILP